MNAEKADVPRGTLAGLRQNWKADLLSGFLVFLIALPLCLGIALACGYPAIAGIFTAIIGGILATFFSNSELTIKGPAAGLIVIAIGCVTEFGFTGGKDPAADFQAYRLALGVGVAAGVIQILFGVFRAGILGEFFPTTAIHGLLASIGVIIIAKQFPVVMGLSPEGSPLHLLANIPTFIMNMNPKIGLIGIVSLLIVFGYPLIKNPTFKVIPAPMIVLFVAVPMGLYLNIGQEGTYTFNDQTYALGTKFLVDVPANMFSALTFPDFSGLTTSIGIRYVIMFALIGSLESLLSAKAVDQIDPWQRKTDMDRDMLAVGVGNTVSAFVGGLPMISEIVRSKANIDNGARTRFANMFHGSFLLVCVALIPGIINQIPLAALGALLVFTGFRLASPHEFVHMYHLGKDQFIVFVSTVIGVLATDLLVGIGNRHRSEGRHSRHQWRPDPLVLQTERGDHARGRHLGDYRGAGVRHLQHLDPLAQTPEPAAPGRENRHPEPGRDATRGPHRDVETLRMGRRIRRKGLRPVHQVDYQNTAPCPTPW